MSTIIGVLFCLLGLWFFLSPQSALKVKIRWAKFFGAKLTVTKKTEQFYKYFGLLFAVIGLLILFKVQIL